MHAIPPPFVSFIQHNPRSRSSSPPALCALMLLSCRLAERPPPPLALPLPLPELLLPGQAAAVGLGRCCRCCCCCRCLGTSLRATCPSRTRCATLDGSPGRYSTSPRGSTTAVTCAVREIRISGAECEWWPRRSATKVLGRVLWRRAAEGALGGGAEAQGFGSVRASG